MCSIFRCWRWKLYKVYERQKASLKVACTVSSHLHLENNAYPSHLHTVPMEGISTWHTGDRLQRWHWAPAPESGENRWIFHQWVCNVFMKEKRELNQNILLSKPHPWGRKITSLLKVRGTELMTKFLGRKNDSLFGGMSSMQRSPTCECWGSACVPGHEEVSEIPQKCS